MICVTNRPHFAELVAIQYEAQTYPNKELVVIDSSVGGRILRHRADVYVREEPGAEIGRVRNVGLEVARGDWFMWLDDDDWRNPNMTSMLMRAADDMGEGMAGMRSFYWIDVDGRMEMRACANWPVFGAAGYRNDRPMNGFRTNTQRKCKTDSLWLLRIREHFGGFGVLVDRPEWYVWVNHGSNIFNRSFNTQSRKPNEHDPRFREGKPNSLSTHMDILRTALQPHAQARGKGERRSLTT